jgi:hypothetical protein
MHGSTHRVSIAQIRGFRRILIELAELTKKTPIARARH